MSATTPRPTTPRLQRHPGIAQDDTQPLPIQPGPNDDDIAPETPHDPDRAEAEHQDAAAQQHDAAQMAAAALYANHLLDRDNDRDNDRSERDAQTPNEAAQARLAAADAADRLRDQQLAGQISHLPQTRDGDPDTSAPTTLINGGRHQTRSTTAYAVTSGEDQADAYREAHLRDQLSGAMTRAADNRVRSAELRQQLDELSAGVDRGAPTRQLGPQAPTPGKRREERTPMLLR